MCVAKKRRDGWGSCRPGRRSEENDRGGTVEVVKEKNILNIGRGVRRGFFSFFQKYEFEILNPAAILQARGKGGGGFKRKRDCSQRY